MKGWQLRSAINSDLYKRSCDIDIMVLEKDYSKAIKMFKERFNFSQRSRYIYGQSCLLHENTMCIDLHTKLVAYQSLNTIFNLDSKELFNETKLTKDENVEYLVFNNEMTLIHLCIHFLLHHKGCGFLLLYELKIFIEKHLLKIERKNLVTIANKYECLPLLLFCLMVIKKLCQLSAKENKWIAEFIEEFDNRKTVFKLFQVVFNKNNFYRDIELPHKVIQQLIIKDIKKGLSFLRGGIQYYIYYLTNSLYRKFK